MNIIATNVLTKRYGRRVGVEDLNLTVTAGELFGFLGPNGSGKTTTIRVLLGFLKPTRGDARLFDMDCWSQSPQIRRDVGYLPGDLRLYSWMNAREALQIFGRIRGQDLESMARPLIERFRLEVDVPVRKMSKGMRQKLGLILVLAPRPRLLVLDEPTSALDPLMQEQLYAELRELTAEGHTVFFSSHTLSEVEQLCDRVGILRNGKLVADETLEALRKQAQREIVVTWRDGQSARATNVPSCLDVQQRGDHTWQCTLSGSLDEFLSWVHAQPVADLSIGHPNLESLFRRYYR